MIDPRTKTNSPSGTRRFVLATVLGWAALSLGWANAGFGNDTIYPVTGRPIGDVNIVSESYKEIVYRLKDVPTDQRIATVRVRDVQYGSPPEAYATGLETMSRGEYENAVQSFRLAIEKGKRPWVNEYCLFQIGECYRLWGRSDASKIERAIETYAELTTKYSKSRFAPAADIARGRSLTAAGRYAEAEVHFAGLENTARSTYGIEWEIEAKLGSANNLEIQRKHGEARSKYTSIATAARNELRRIPEGDAVGALRRKQLERLADSARLREGICLIRAGSFTQAESFYSTMISEAIRNNNLGRLGGAYNGRGEAYFNLKNYEKAYIDFAQTAAVYFFDEAETARALYYCGLTLEARDGKPSARSKSYFQEVTQFYPNSEWAAKAKSKK